MEARKNGVQNGFQYEEIVQPANILKIESLSDEWRDKDLILLHACFQLLKDFFEKEKKIIEGIN